jgi:hypothetical protein
MKNHANLIAFGTFGSPNGFKQTFFSGRKELAISIKTFDLNTNAISLFPNSKVYSIRKEHIAGSNSIAYSVYTYAKEQNSERAGTFIGSSILFVNRIGSEKIIVNQLNEFHSNVVSRNIHNNIISVNHSDNLIVSKPTNFENLESSLRGIEELDFNTLSGLCLVVFTSTTPEDISVLFKKSIVLLNVYDTIYFTDSAEVASFVNQKKIFKLIQNVGNKLDFENEIQAFEAKRRKFIEQSIEIFQLEIRKLREERTNTISDFKNRIAQNQKKHKENEVVISQGLENVSKLEKSYSVFENEIQDLVNRIKAGQKVEDVKLVYNESKNRFINEVNSLKNQQYLTTITEINTRQNFESQRESIGKNDARKQLKEQIHESESSNDWGIDIFKISSLLLLISLIGSWSYFLISSNSNGETTDSNPNTITLDSKREDHQEKSNENEISDQTQTLKPEPNTELNENDLRLVAKELAYKSKIDDVVKTIFAKNPSDIKNHYKGQEREYAHILFSLNKHCFEKDDDILYFVHDTLRHIPAYRKGK